MFVHRSVWCQSDQRREMAISVVTVINYSPSPRFGERGPGGEGFF